MFWFVAAALSAVFAGLTSILAKCGIKKTDSDLATALRTVVVLAFSWIMVLVVGSYHTIMEIDGESMIFLILSGLATGASWMSTECSLLRVFFQEARRAYTRHICQDRISWYPARLRKAP